MPRWYCDIGTAYITPKMLFSSLWTRTMPPKKGGTGSVSGDDATAGGAEVLVESKEVPSGNSVQALATAPNDNITHQRTLHETLGNVLTQLLPCPPAAPMAPMDHDAFATALAPSLASAVNQMSGPKKVDPGRPGSEPFRSFPRPDLKPLPAAAEAKESELFDLTEFDPHADPSRKSSTLVLFPRAPHQRACSPRGRPHRQPSRLHLSRPASRARDLCPTSRRDRRDQRQAWLVSARSSRRGGNRNLAMSRSNRQAKASACGR